MRPNCRYGARVRPICFVTGGGGFVGRHLVPRLAERFAVRALLRQGQRLPGLADGSYETVAGRLADQDALAAGVRSAEVVVHLAALVSFRPEDRASMFAINTEATAQLAAAARLAGVRRFLHCSTISAIACREHPEVVDETAPYNFGPLRSGYCDSKFAAEQRVLAEVSKGLDAVIVNPPSMYGAGDRRKGDDSLLTAVLQGRIGWAPPGGINVANVDDVCTGMLQALDLGRTGERYILGGENVTGRALLDRIAGIVQGLPPRHTLPAIAVRLAAGALHLKERLRGSRPPLTSEVLRLAARYLWFSSAKAEAEFGYVARPFDDGVRAAWHELRAGAAR